MESVRVVVEVLMGAAIVCLTTLFLSHSQQTTSGATSVTKASKAAKSHNVPSSSPSTDSSSTADSESSTDEGRTAKETARQKDEKAKKKVDKQKKNAEKKEKEAEDEKRRYKTVDEAWKNSQWTEIELEKRADDSTKLLFIVRRRYNNNLRNRNEPEEPIVYVNLYSPHLVRVLRKQLKRNEDIFADVPLVEAKAIFLIHKELEAYRAEIAEKIPTMPAVVKEGNHAKAVTTKPTDENSMAGKAAQEAGCEDSDAKEEEAEPTREDLEAEVEHLDILFGWITDAFGATQSKLDRMLPQHQISWNLLWYIFRQDVKVVVAHDTTKEKLGVTITSTSYADRGNDTSNFQVNGCYLVWDGRRYQRALWFGRVSKFSGTVSLASLPMYPLSAKVEEELKLRGRLVASYAGVRYLSYQGVLVQTQGSGLQRKIVKAPADGRVMVDVVAFRRKKPMMDVFRDEEEEYDDPEIEGDFIDELEEDDYWQLPPTLHGFSFALKSWGELSVGGLSEVKFARDSFDHLVLPEEQKRLIRGIVDASRSENRDAIVKDFISEKGGGITICLHGSPGAGKTLTAEACAEELERPLYVVGSGELGCSADTVEDNLREVFDLAESWSAVILIDEADVFLEARSLHELARNSLVSTFLRLLDSSKATLFLTTNRVKSFDPAFLSRFNIALKYPSLDRAARLQVWTRFLKLAHVPLESDPANRTEAIGLVNGYTAENSADEDADDSRAITKPKPLLVTKKELAALAAKSLNGRTIRNCIQTAQSIAISEGVPLSLGHINNVIDVTESFLKDFKDMDEDAVYAAKGEGLHDNTRMYY